MILNKTQWDQFIDGYHVRGGAIGFDNSRYCFILQQPDSEVELDEIPLIRLLYVRMERPPERRFFRVGFSGVEYVSIAAGTTGGIDEFIGVDMRGTIMTYNDVVDKVGLEDPGITTRWRHDRSAPVNRVKRVNGKLYAICQDRRILERKGTGQWNEFPALERPAERISGDTKVMMHDFGFSDMDAFSETDLYAVGGGGDVWQYNGSAWRHCNFPSKESLETVCCSGNGEVYVSGTMGSLWVGRGDEWTRITEGKYIVSFNDTVWFAGKLWLANDYALYTLEGNVILPADVDPSVQLTTGKLSLSSDNSQLLSAGKHGASLFDGTSWQVLFNALEINTNQ
ncbi:hypothetical protein HHL16_15805 [Pseudoflavitalea sp. G-6-1-2]|uniref:hypothetical protein n=1 Tax=Pseudoflavitalea sp. G-6-1-2 TaxID=2728841 RepID=UPI00146C0E88|nr:hypothetical protein [Pseudoflavitalea sp. G-6-1-2]NML22348.1 hypothetical protein [Pseudoflavitalea sp. G-6-1-2]